MLFKNINLTGNTLEERACEILSKEVRKKLDQALGKLASNYGFNFLIKGINKQNNTAIIQVVSSNNDDTELILEKVFNSAIFGHITLRLDTFEKIEIKLELKGANAYLCYDFSEEEWEITSSNRLSSEIYKKR